MASTTCAGQYGLSSNALKKGAADSVVTYLLQELRLLESGFQHFGCVGVSGDCR